MTRTCFGLCCIGYGRLSLTCPFYESRALRELIARLIGLSDRLAISIQGVKRFLGRKSWEHSLRILQEVSVCYCSNVH